jgi:uncharacterized damage-inducible protein DinB
MKELLRQYAAYNAWANQKLFELILSLPEEMHTRELANSFPSLYKTILHMHDAESIWWQRLKMQERIIVPSETMKGKLEEVVSSLLNQSRQWEEWIGTASDLAIEHVCQYQNSKREHFKQPVYQMILQVLNHNSYHRGQLVTMLRQLNVEKIPQTDYIVWARRK